MTLNVIVHQSMLEDEANEPSAIPGEHAEAVRTLARINAVKASNPTNTVNFEGFDFHSLPGICKGHKDVVLYGCCRTECLANATKALGYRHSISYDIEGTAF